MKEIIKEIILDFQSEKLQTGISRCLDYQIVKNKIFVLIGVRRCGKTTLLYQIVDKLISEKKALIKDIVYVNFFDDRLTELKNGNLHLIPEVYYTLYPENKSNKTVFFFFDEIQEAKNWELFVERLNRTENCRIFLSGSSSKMLSKEISTHLRGRSLTWELFPFSFKEFLNFNKCPYNKLNSKSRYRIQNLFIKYFKTGGFPETADKNSKIRLLIHQEYYKSILHRDIIERYNIRHPQAVMQIGHRLINSVASLYSVNRITEFAKSRGFGVSKTFVAECMDWFEDSYFLFTVKLFNKSINVQNTNPKKIYCIDHGLVRSVSSNIGQKEGHLFKNMIFVHLRSHFNEIYYYKTSTGKEIDFLWISDGEGINLAQVCFELRRDETKKREVQALLEGMNELNVKKSYIITQDLEEEISSGNKTIEIIPVWKFLIF